MKPWVRIAFWAIVAAQLAFLIGFIGVREVALRTGTEVMASPSTRTAKSNCAPTSPSPCSASRKVACRRCLRA